MSTLLRAPSLGPMVGHTTSSGTRLWMRSENADTCRSIGVAALYENGVYVSGSARYFRLRREYDRTGVVDFSALKSNCQYAARLCSLTLDTLDPFEENSDEEVFDTLPPPENWRKQLEIMPENEVLASFCTFPAGVEDRLSFVFGSCRYPGLLWGKKRADSIFRSVLKRFENNGEAMCPRFLMMVGDQIYADTLPKDLGISVADTENEFRERYMSAFGANNTRELLRKVPTYMILDDHEIEDNWVQGRMRHSEKRSLFNLAIQAYMSYQWYHSPRNYGRYLYYSFDVAGFAFFVVDGRTQRIRDDDDYVLTDNHLLGRPGKGTGYKGQIDLLCEWLVEQQKLLGDRPKFVVTASVFVPNAVTTTRGSKGKADDDAWAAFPETRRQLLTVITENRVQNVVFLSGDIHCSNVAALEFTETTSGVKSALRAFSVTSSAFYWPYPFADGNPLDFVHDSRKEQDSFTIGNGWTMDYQAWNFEQNDNFTQVDIDLQQNKLFVRTFDRHGGSLTNATLNLA